MIAQNTGFELLSGAQINIEKFGLRSTVDGSIARVTTDPGEIKTAAEIICETYIERGYLEPGTSESCISPLIYHGLEVAIPMVSLDASGTIRGGVTFVKKRPLDQHLLPCEKVPLFAERIKDRIANNLTLAEVTLFGDDTLIKKNMNDSLSIAQGMITSMMVIGRKLGIKEMLIVLNKRHSQFFKRGYGYDQLTDYIECEFVNKAKGALFGLKLEKLLSYTPQMPPFAKKSHEFTEAVLGQLRWRIPEVCS